MTKMQYLWRADVHGNDYHGVSCGNKTHVYRIVSIYRHPK
jgi:hypothetical protein